jgi:hypothetical protein
MNMPTIMVQMDDHKWTLAALHQACEQARKESAQVVLALMLPERHCVLANIDVNQYVFSEAECEELEAYTAIATQYRVPLTTRVFEYRDLEAGIGEAADALNATTVYAHVPETMLPFLHNRQVRQLEQTLEARHHHLRAFEIPAVSPN